MEMYLVDEPARTPGTGVDWHGRFVFFGKQLPAGAGLQKMVITKQALGTLLFLMDRWKQFATFTAFAFGNFRHKKSPFQERWEN